MTDMLSSNLRSCFTGKLKLASTVQYIPLSVIGGCESPMMFLPFASRSL